jgi:hypothetical protein
VQVTLLDSSLANLHLSEEEILMLVCGFVGQVWFF